MNNLNKIKLTILLAPSLFFAITSLQTQQMRNEESVLIHELSPWGQEVLNSSFSAIKKLKGYA
jgi:hypothetical protein